jgi:hypothetical protein
MVVGHIKDGRFDNYWRCDDLITDPGVPMTLPVYNGNKHTMHATSPDVSGAQTESD